MEAHETRIYVGRVQDGRPEVYAVATASVEALHSPLEPFEWGSGAHSGLELARVLLTDASGSEPPADVCMRFAEQILSRLPKDGFALQRETIKAWLRRVVTV